MTPYDNSSRQYNPLAALNEAKRDRTLRDAYYAGDKVQQETVKFVYRDILLWVQNKISETENYNRTLQDLLDKSSSDSDETVKLQLRNIINRLLQTYNPPIPPNLIEYFNKRIFEDMAGYGILTDYLDDSNVEEINIYGPGPRQIEIVPSRGKPYMLEEGFPDKQAVLDIIKRMVRKGNMTVDRRTPRVDSYLGGGTRISVMIEPIVREDKGAYASIRKQTQSKITKEELITTKTATPEEIRLIELLMRNNVSGALVGATGSGKTTMLNFMLGDYMANNKSHPRLYIIEESRELQLAEDARVFYTAVCGDAKEGTQITAPDLLKSALRFHPSCISCAEMRGEEAMNAMSAAQTGHVVWSTLHADNCEEAYLRILTMCKMSGTDLSENLLMRNIVKAFPIMISVKQLKDGTRKITGIYEAESVDGTQVVGHYIYQLRIKKFEYNEDGSVAHVRGAHCRVGNISDELAQKIFDNCGRLEDVIPFAREGWRPAGYVDDDADDYLSAAEELLKEGIDADEVSGPKF